ncbi:hypothetical protein DQ04_01761150 [Trypanosoma grayi]|uniref:hypothetical protein n=1 Tax=Trypanosoma grayi TaxID=71804 RepID=UPI0004F497F8|nr:hypothetical protein DQ04_01761150 [Trypanosoma grayi]KEG12380.1 hypothetical protein DQ04_01761150 [Trypanosoma grayi]
MADAADLIRLGVWYSSAGRSGLLSTFLMVVVDAEAPPSAIGKYKTVCKIGNGLDAVTQTMISTKLLRAMEPVKNRKCPPWLSCRASYLPDMLMRDPSEADVMEIIGAEISVSQIHTAGIFLRFPRIWCLQPDKCSAAVSTLQELHHLLSVSGNKVAQSFQGEDPTCGEWKYFN